MKQYSFYIRKINITLAIAVWLFVGGNAFAQSQPSASQPDNEAPQFLTNAPPPGFATRVDYLKSFTSEKDILNAYHAGLINKDESMLAVGALEDKEEDKASMDTYGKVVDQDGQPVAGVKVLGRLELGIGEYKDYHAETDKQGLFQFLGSHGSGLILHFQKQGYDFDGNLLPERPNNYLPDPSNPLIVTMWKLRGAEPMVHIQINSEVPCDGSAKSFDLLSDRQNNSGDLMVKLIRNPININRRIPFDWSVTFGITNGGLQDATNLYLNLAPVEGYQPTITLNFPTNMVGWQKEINTNYYFKLKGGQAYGRIAIHVLADRPQPPTYFDADIYANPTNSRNLEFDPQKEVRR